MNEAEWLSCIDSSVMLHFLHRKAQRGKLGASDRKFRLFFCARCRKEWGNLPDRRSRRAVEVAEKFADGLASRAELRNAEKIAKAAMEDAFAGSDHSTQSASLLAWWTTFHDAGLRAWQEPGLARDYDAWYEEEAADGPDSATAARSVAILQLARALERAHHAEILHDLFGNPFRRATVKRAWLTPMVIRLTQTMYSKRAFDRVPELAPALEQAGCAKAEILSHCRQPGEHVRGCWALDLILDKE